MPKSRAASKVAENPQAVAKELVSQIYDVILKGNCVVFLGSGSTTEGHRQERGTFYEHIKELCKFPGADHSFPELMHYFFERMDGGHHHRLIRESLYSIEFFLIA